MHDVLFGLAAGGGQPSGLGKVSLAGQVVAGQRIGYLINLPGDRLTEDGEEEAGSLIPAYTCTGGTAGSLAAARGPRARRTCCMAISTAPANATAGHAEISAPSSPYPAP